MRVSMERAAAILLSVLVFAACGGISSVSAGGGGGGSGGTPLADAGADAGWTPCSAPGITLCRGPNDCPADLDTCGCIIGDAGIVSSDASVGVCMTSPVFHDYLGSGCNWCADGELCADWFGWDDLGGWDCAPWEVGVLYAQNGAPELVRYADRARFTGDPLPAPATCPNLGFPICGANCGSCPDGATCTGRSPKHPYGLCVKPRLTPDRSAVCSTTEPCPSGYGCFIYEVEANAQPVADKIGFCLALEYCQGAAAKLPGGGKCIAP